MGAIPLGLSQQAIAFASDPRDVLRFFFGTLGAKDDARGRLYAGHEGNTAAPCAMDRVGLDGVARHGRTPPPYTSRGVSVFPRTRFPDEAQEEEGGTQGTPHPLDEAEAEPDDTVFKSVLVHASRRIVEDVVTFSSDLIECTLHYDDGTTGAPAVVYPHSFASHCYNIVSRGQGEGAVVMEIERRCGDHMMVSFQDVLTVAKSFQDGFG